MPTLSILVATALALVAAFPAVACSPVGSPIFKPEKSNVVLHTDSKTGYVLHPPAPIVRAATVHRGTGSDGVSCADAGSLTVDLALPSDSPYSPNELGFYFRVIEGENVLAGYSI